MAKCIGLLPLSSERVDPGFTYLVVTWVFTHTAVLSIYAVCIPICLVSNI